MLKYRRIFIVLMLGLSLFLTGCTGLSKLKELRVLDYKIESVDMDGRDVQAVLNVKIDNPSKQLSVSDVKGRINLKEDEVAVYRANPIVIDGQATGNYPVVVRFSLSEEMSMFRLLTMLKTLHMDDLSTDVSARLKVKGGIRTKVKLDRYPLGRMGRSFLGKMKKKRI